MPYTASTLCAVQATTLSACTAGCKYSHPALEKLACTVPEDQFSLVCDFLAQLMQPDMQRRASVEAVLDAAFLTSP